MISYKSCCTAIFLATITFASSTLGRTQTAISFDSPVRKANCGIRSILNLSQYLGKAPNTVRENELCQEYQASHISMLEIQAVARGMGIELTGVEATLKELEKLQQPFIALLPDHFVFVERIEGQWVRYSEDGSFLLKLRTLFEKDYRGKALVLPASKGVDLLRITPSTIDWNQIPVGSSVRKATVTLTNFGKRNIDIEGITTSCSCTVPSQYPKTIKPGQKVPIEITVHLPDVGSFMQTVTVRSNSVYPRQEISLSGTLQNDIRISPTQVDYGDIAVGEEATKFVMLSDLDKRLPRPLSLFVRSPQFSARLEPAGNDVWKVTLTLKAPHAPTLIDEVMRISGPKQGGRTAVVPVRARVVSMTRTRPEQAFFGSVTSEQVTHTLQVFRQDGRPFEITEVRAPAYLRCSTESLNRNNSRWRLNITIAAKQAPAQVADHVIVATKFGLWIEEISVPVLALVEKNSTTGPGTLEASRLSRAEDDFTVKIGLASPITKIGQTAPDFQLADSNANPWKLSAMRGTKNVLLTFFPKCFTGGCANHLSSLRDHQAEFDALNTQILAVSVDPADGEEGQRAFADQWKLNFPLIPDTQRQLSMLYGATQNTTDLAARQTIIIDKQGIVRYIDTDVHVTTHGADMLAKMRELGMTK